MDQLLAGCKFLKPKEANTAALGSIMSRFQPENLLSFCDLSVESRPGPGLQLVIRASARSTPGLQDLIRAAEGHSTVGLDSGLGDDPKRPPPARRATLTIAARVSEDIESSGPLGDLIDEARSSSCFTAKTNSICMRILSHPDFNLYSGHLPVFESMAGTNERNTLN